MHLSLVVEANAVHLHKLNLLNYCRTRLKCNLMLTIDVIAILTTNNLLSSL